jgi:hypothetical protein
MVQFLIRPIIKMVQGWDVFISYTTILINIHLLTSKILKERIMMFSSPVPLSLFLRESLPWIIRTTFQSSVSFVPAFDQSVDKNSHRETVNEIKIIENSIFHASPCEHNSESKGSLKVG